MRYLTPGDLHMSPYGVGDKGGNDLSPKPVEKSDYFIVAWKFWKRDGAKGVTEWEELTPDN